VGLLHVARDICSSRRSPIQGDLKTSMTSAWSGLGLEEQVSDRGPDVKLKQTKDEICDSNEASTHTKVRADEIPGQVGRTVTMKGKEVLGRCIKDTIPHEKHLDSSCTKLTRRGWTPGSSANLLD
jgi:hypothetical protein